MSKPRLPDVLLTERLRCERFTLQHVEELAILDADPVVQVTIRGRARTREETETGVGRRVAYWDEHRYGDYVVRTADGEFVGCAGVFPDPRPGAVAVGYALRPVHWRKGYATELCTVIARHVAAIHAGDVLATVVEHNLASRRVLEKSGFILVGPDAENPGTLLYRYRGG